LKVSTHDNPTAGLGNVLNEKQYEYGKYNMLEKEYQEWTGSVNTGTSRKVQYAYSYPTDGTTGLRRTSTTYTDGTVIDDVYSSGIDDTISRLSGQKKSGTWLYQESYLGLGRLVRRQYGTTGVEWTLIGGADTANQDYYFGLDRFGRIDQLVVKSSTQYYNWYEYAYNYNAQATLRRDYVGNVAGSYEFDEIFTYDNLGRLTDHQRGSWNGTSMSPLKLHECWTFDRSGNRTAYYSGTSSACGSSATGTFNSSNEWASWSGGTITYINPGEMTRKANHYFDYQAFYQKYTVKYVDILLSSYKYNGEKQKIARNDSSLANTYYYLATGGRVVDEIDQSSGSLLKNYVWGTQYIDDIVAKNAASPEFSILDANFNVVTRINSSGTVLAHYVYKSYGNPTELASDWSTIQTISDEHHLFTGRLYHVDHVQYDLRHRDQDPGQNCFMQRDPIGIWGDGINFGNAYAYVGNDPFNRSDAFGLFGLLQVAQGGQGLLLGRAPAPLAGQPAPQAPSPTPQPPTPPQAPQGSEGGTGIETPNSSSPTSNCGGSSLNRPTNVNWPGVNTTNCTDSNWAEARNTVPKGCREVDCDKTSLTQTQCDCSYMGQEDIEFILFLWRGVPASAPPFCNFHMVGRNPCKKPPEAWHTKRGAGPAMTGITNPEGHTSKYYSGYANTKNERAKRCFCCISGQMQYTPTGRGVETLKGKE
jgi:RHS repeat-associated protein